MTTDAARERVITVTRRERLVDKTCPVCGQAFTGLSRQRYCSTVCQKRADYQRHAEGRRAANRERYRRRKEQAVDG